MSNWNRVARYATSGIVVGGIVAYAGVTFANTPATLQTCSHVTRAGVFGPARTLRPGQICPGKTVTQTWVDQRYLQIMEDAAPGAGKASTSYAGFDLHGLSLPDGGVSGSTIGDLIGQFGSANFSGSGLFNATWDNDNFQAANFTGAVLSGSALHGDNFSDANFTNAKLTGADFTGSDMASVVYSNTTCPNGSNSSGHGGSCAGQGGGL